MENHSNKSKLANITIEIYKLISIVIWGYTLVRNDKGISIVIWGSTLEINHIFKKYINGDNKKHAKKIQVLISDLKSVRKNTI